MKNTYTKILVLFLGAILCITSSYFVTIAQAESFNKTKAKKNITVTYKKISDGIVAIYKNKNDYPVKLTGKMKFLDSDKSAIKTLKDVNYCLAAKSSAVIFYPAPYDSNGNYINYTSYKGSFSVSKTSYKSYSSKIKVSKSINTIDTNFSAINNSGKNLENIRISILFYDSNGEILGCKMKYLNCYKKGSVDLFNIDHAMNWATPAKAKVYVDFAY